MPVLIITGNAIKNVTIPDFFFSWLFSLLPVINWRSDKKTYAEEITKGTIKNSVSSIGNMNAKGFTITKAHSLNE